MYAAYLDEWDAYLRYLDLPGSEPAVVFVPGSYLAGTAAFISATAEPGLGDRRRIIVDLLGGGYSDRPDDFGYSLEDHAGTLASLIDNLGVERCGVIGHSLGGAVAIELAAKRPDLVGCLILAEANLDPVGAALTRFVTKYLESEFVARGHTDLLDDLKGRAHQGDRSSPIALGIFAATDPLALHRSLVGLARGTKPIMRHLLVQMKIPRLYVFGEQSLPDEDYHWLPRSGIEVAVVPGAGHAMPVDNPAGFARVVESFIQSWLLDPASQD